MGGSSGFPQLLDDGTLALSWSLVVFNRLGLWPCSGLLQRVGHVVRTFCITQVEGILLGILQWLPLYLSNILLIRGLIGRNQSHVTIIA